VDDNLFSGNTTIGETGTNATGNNIPLVGLTNEQQCNNFGGCECTANSTIIADGTYCTDSTKTIFTTEASALTCSDHDGCTCSFDSNNYAVNTTSISCTNGTPTVLSNNQQCTDPDTCTCNGAVVAVGGYCRIPTSGGGGSSSTATDVCPNGDYTSSYYDGSCGVPNSNGDLSLGGVVGDDTFSDFSITDKAQLLAGEYEALVAQGETTLRHGEFFTILFKYAELKNISNDKLKVIVKALASIFSDMSETTLVKYGFDKTILIQELERLAA
jgi:hypothetical protein